MSNSGKNHPSPGSISLSHDPSPSMISYQSRENIQPGEDIEVEQWEMMSTGSCLTARHGLLNVRKLSQKHNLPVTGGKFEIFCLSVH